MIFRLRAGKLLLPVMVFAANVVAAGEGVDFQRDIRPLLSDKCFSCHGPAEEHREAELRLDVADAAHRSVIVPGKPGESEAYLRVVTDDEDLRMPPHESGESLTEEEAELLRRWISEGAEYEAHWAFVSPERPDLPRVAAVDWGHNPIDRFVLANLERQKLAPSPETDRTTWLRRLSLDVIGLPPTIAEVDRFLADGSPDAVQRQVDRLLASPHFGERWARIWLDAARYADSNGYEKDAPREVWFYRDWVVNAFNRDLPYNDFVIRQIAGDLLAKRLPNAKPKNPFEDAALVYNDAAVAAQDLTVATGFLRNSMVNEEGGAAPEQFRMEAMYDRMDAIGKSILGLTIQCSQCHSHKYDPLQHEEYYNMFAFLNNTHDATISAYTSGDRKQQETVLQQIIAIEQDLKASTPNWKQRLAEWEASLGRSPKWDVLETVDLPYGGTKYRALADRSVLSEGYAPRNSDPQFKTLSSAEKITGFRIELLTHPQLPRRGPGRSVRGAAALSEIGISIAPQDTPDQQTKLKLVSATADVNREKSSQPEYLRNIKAKDGDSRVVGPAYYAIDGDFSTAWTTDVDPVHRNQTHNIVFVPEAPVGFSEGSEIRFHLHMKHGGWNGNDNHNCLMGRFRFSVTNDPNPTADTIPVAVRELLEIPDAERTNSQKAAIFRHWRTTVSEWADANQKIVALWQQYPEGAGQLVLEAREQPRTTSLLERGDFLSPVKQVGSAVPEFLHPLAEVESGENIPGRLRFARWLVDRKSPTTARSIVNRIWQAYFGIGLTETSDDLGSQGSLPSHRELLDWLAVELMDNNWSLKHIHRLIASSATYRQSSNIIPEMQQRDPYNRLLARGPRFRIDAEVVRDSTLAVSGLLNSDMGGPPVFPPAPQFLFRAPASYGEKSWNEETGANRYRRGLYTFRFRSVPYPMLETFDAVPGNVSCVRRSRSNTPMQALTSLNEPLFMECSQALAAVVIRHGGETDSSRLHYVVRRCLSRQPHETEIATLQHLLTKQRSRLQAGELDAAAISGTPADADEDLRELAAWTLISRVLLNLDETITKE